MWLIRLLQHVWNERKYHGPTLLVPLNARDYEYEAKMAELARLRAVNAVAREDVEDNGWAVLRQRQLGGMQGFAYSGDMFGLGMNHANGLAGIYDNRNLSIAEYARLHQLQMQALQQAACGQSSWLSGLTSKADSSQRRFGMTVEGDVRDDSVSQLAFKE